MRILFKILLFPITLILTALVLFCQFVCLIGTTLLSILASLLGVVALGILLFSGQPAEGFKYLIIAFCISPYGIPMLAAWLLSKAEAFNELLKSV
ncbi:CD1845 family protein [Enterocloster bolteae]|uniref:CD1845 family protein n=1 Tax=Enterocloster bolteae TaxID=208479 RepID=UPI00210C0574|nr:CD1845 family protein [Enterocloster bolteae]MCQ4758996.1 CD1845 family protein [Enterocloster bolteae]